MRNRLSPSVWLSTRRDCQTWFCLIRNQWKAASPGGAQRCARRRPAADRLELIVQLVRVVHLEQVGERYGSGAAMAKWVGDGGGDDGDDGGGGSGVERGEQEQQGGGEEQE